MSAAQVEAIKKALLILWKYKGQIAEAILFLTDLIARNAKKDSENEREKNSQNSFAD